MEELKRYLNIFVYKSGFELNKTKMVSNRIHFVPVKIKENNELIKALSNPIIKLVNNSKAEVLEVYYTIQFKSLVDNALKFIEQRHKINKKIRLKKLTHSTIAGHVVGCDFFQVSGSSIFLAENIFHSIPYLHSVIYSAARRKFKSEEEHSLISLLNDNLLSIKKVELVKHDYTEEQLEELKALTMFSHSFYFNYYFNLISDKKFIKKSEKQMKRKESYKKTEKITLNRIEIDLDNLLKTFKEQIQKQFVDFENSKNVGIIVETKKGQSNMFLAKRIKEIVRKLNKEKNKDRKIFMFLSNNINQKEMIDFNFIDFWINTACPRIIDNFSSQKEDKNEEYEIRKTNIINANDFIMMLKYFSQI